MNKSDAISIFGTTLTEMARALGRGKSAVSQWPEKLTEDQINLVVGAAVRQGKSVPAKFIKNTPHAN